MAVCKKESGMLSDTFQAEGGALLQQVISKSFIFFGGPYALFEMDKNGKPTGTWSLCISYRTLSGIAVPVPDLPYVTTSLPALQGVTATCPQQPPGPSLCQAVLAQYVDANNLVAIGTPRLTDIAATAIQPASVKYWAPVQHK